MNTTPPAADMKAVIDAIRDLHWPTMVDVSRGTSQTAPILAIPNGMKLESTKPFLDAFALQPERRKGTAKLTDLPSFIDFTNRQKNDDSVLFAAYDPTARVQRPSITAVLNYHPAGGDNLDARFGDHRAVYTCPLDEAWTAWCEKDGEGLTQAEFAEFLEERILDIAPPPQADSGDEADRRILDLLGALGGNLADAGALVTLSRGLSVNVNQKVAQAVRLQSGEAQIIFAEEHKDDRGEPVRVPQGFLVAIPVFQFGALYRIFIRLRYRVTNGSVVWAFEMHRADKVFEHAFREAATEAAAATQLPVWFGSPEA